MKKQFLRVKQLADQTFLKADKTEGLNQDELRKADVKVDFIQKALTEVAKKLPNNSVVELQDKRIKKYDEYNIKLALDTAVQEQTWANESVLYNVLKKTANAEEQLAHEKFEHEKQIEEHVSKPINRIVDTDLPSISKYRKTLNKHILDKDSATNRYQNAKKMGKENNLKEEADEADSKLDQTRDLLASEMFTLLRRENEICTFFLQLLKMQRSYHESACKLLQEVIPVLEQTVGENKIKPIFGSCLRDHLKTNDRVLAFPLEICVLSLMELGMSEEGLFRLTGSGSKVKRLKNSIDSGCFTLPLIAEYKDVHVLASTLKMYLRELPEPLLTYKLYNEWMRCIECGDEERIANVHATLAKLPRENRDNLAFLMQFLARLSQHPENRMSTSNIAIVIGPNLLWSQEDMNMALCSTLNMIVELFLIHVDDFFPDDMLKFAQYKIAEVVDSEDFTRPDISCLRQSMLLEADGMDTSSPKPSSRKKTRHAPAPPPSTTRNELDSLGNGENYYLSSIGTASLNRSHKIRADTNNSRHSSLVDLLDTTDTTSDHHLLVNAPTENTPSSNKPVAAPRTLILPDVDTEVTLRTRPIEDTEPRRTKPAIPTRPASLRAVGPRTYDAEQNFVRNFAAAHKVPRTFPAGHDNQIAEKEKFLGHVGVDVVAVRPPQMKSTEKLNDDAAAEKMNGNQRKTSHVRTRSDGNIVDLSAQETSSLLHAPQSPRSLSKPSQPPPPPPNVAPKAAADINA